MLHWFLPYVIFSYPRIWPYLVTVTDNEDFDLSDRGLLDDNVSASVSLIKTRALDWLSLI